MLQSKHGGRTGTGLAHLAVKMNLMVQNDVTVFD